MPVVLTILDGVGLRDEEYGNAVKLANKPVFDYLWNNYPHSKLVASSREVGLPLDQMGNSEVGHMNIGAGRVIYQPLERINQSIEDGSFFKNDEILKVFNHVKDNNSKLHIMGLISDGGVHSHISHLMTLLDFCKKEGVNEVYLHLFTDGRDVLPKSSDIYLRQVEGKLKMLGIGVIATISGRYYGMDRDNNYDRLKLSYDAIVNGIGPCSSSVNDYVISEYEKGITDEFFTPTIFDKEGMISSNDGMVVFNFRKDRLREMLTALTNPEFSEFSVKNITNFPVVTMFPVVNSVIASHAFDDVKFDNTLGEYIEKQGLSQLRIAETEKFAHVTYFFDGGREVDYEHEEKILIPSPKVKTYDLKPEMSAREITSVLLDRLGDFDLIILNFANGDMVGHTGVLSKAVDALEVVDECLGKIYNRVKELGGTLIVTADHGNCEEMLDIRGNVLTSHTTNLVPFIVAKNDLALKDGKLSDIAPTILELMNLEIPSDMTGESLIIK